MGNASVKLMFPSHGMPFVLPYSAISDIESKIDELIKDIEGSGGVSRGSGKLRLPSAGLELEYPRPNDWILVDIHNPSIIHRSMSSSLVRHGGTYMVLPNHASRLSKEALKEAVEIIKLPREDEDRDEGLPGYTYTSTTRKR